MFKLNRNKQRGYMKLDGLGWLLTILGGCCVAVGVFVGWALPHVWSWLKPMIHAATAG